MTQADGAGVGLSLQPDALFLDLLDHVIRNDLDYVEVAPETLQRQGRDGLLHPNGFHRQLLALLSRSRLFCVAHGVGLSLATAASPRFEQRFERRLAQVTADQRAFSFRWYSDHCAATALDGQELQLPLPALFDATSVERIAHRLQRLQAIVPDVGIENTVTYFALGDPLDEARAITRITRETPRTWLVLDLHNLYTMALNLDFDFDRYLQQLDLDRVIELHVSGGAESDPRWLTSRRSLRLDSHDAAVPEAVWQLLERVAPRCSRLRGVTLERMEGSVDAQAVAGIRDELARIRDITRAAGRSSRGVRRTGRDAAPEKQQARAPTLSAHARPCADTSARCEAVLAKALCTADPMALIESAAGEDAGPATAALSGLRPHADAVRIAALLVARLRFERLLQCSERIADAFASDASAFAALFRRFHHTVAPGDLHPQADAERFERFLHAEAGRNPVPGQIQIQNVELKANPPPPASSQATGVTSCSANTSLSGCSS